VPVNDSDSRDPTGPQVPRGLLRCSETGRYVRRAEYLRSTGVPRNYITALDAALDVTALEPGEYQLTLRREGSEWQMFTLRVR